MDSREGHDGWMMMIVQLYVSLICPWYVMHTALLDPELIGFENACVIIIGSERERMKKEKV